MSFITTDDGVEIFYKDWGPKDAPVIFFHHGWPLSADDWDTQMLYFLSQGFRVIAHDRRGHGRSTQTWDGNDMDHYAADVAALVDHLEVNNAVHVGHSAGGGEVARYVARQGQGVVSKAVLISAVPPLMVKTDANPEGLPKDTFDGFQKKLAENRSTFFHELPAGPFYGFNRLLAKSSEPIIWNWWRQAMLGGAKAQSDGIVAWSQTDFTDDLRRIQIPVLVLHGDDDQVVPYKDSAPKTAQILANAKLKTYEGGSHGLPTMNADEVNADILAFLSNG